MTPRFRHTVVIERVRAVALGILATAPETFLLLIAVQWFHASPTYKALIPASVSMGLFLSPFSLLIMRKFVRTPSQAAAIIWGISALGFFLSMLSDSLMVFFCGVSFAMILQNLSTPLVTQLYQQNYPEKRRGRSYSQTAFIKILTAIICSYLFGLFMNQQLEQYKTLLALYALASFISAWLLHRCVTDKIVDPDEPQHILNGFRYLKTDLLFRNTLISWMILGFGNLMTVPLRVEFLGNPEHGLSLSPSEVALYVGVIPSAARLLLSPVWGVVFDRFNFSLTRVCINLSFALGVFSFFIPGSSWALVLGSIAYGVGNAGGDVAWQLWVTKLAPHNRVSDYMAVHVFFTGLRGIIAPFIGFYLMHYFSIDFCAWLAVFLILFASALFLRERGNFAAR